MVPYVSIKDDNQVLENSLRQSLFNNGFNEHYSNSLYSKKDIENSSNKAVKLKNPLSKEFEYLRNDLVPGLLIPDSPGVVCVLDCKNKTANVVVASKIVAELIQVDVSFEAGSG